MRVLLVSHRFPPDAVGGVERTTEGLAQGLRELGDDVSVVTRRAAAAPPTPRPLRERQRNGVVVYRFVGGQVSTERFLLHQERLERLFTIALLETKPDIVHFNHLIGFSPTFVDIAQRYGATTVLFLHDFFFACPLAHLRKFSGELCAGPNGGHECAQTCFAGEGAAASLRWGLRTAYFRRLLSRPSRIICPSTHVATYFEEFGADRRRLRIVRNGVADEIVPMHRPMSRPNQHLTIAFCGTVVPHKGVHTILQALRVARLGPARLLVLGALVDVPYYKALKQLAGTIPGLETRFYGEYALHELPSLLAGVDCVVVPSEVPETGGGTTLEALACGVPVVAARLGALPEALNEGVNGLTFEAARPAKLAGILHRLATDMSLLNELRAGAQLTRPPSMTAYTSAVRAIYEEALAEPAEKWSWGDSQEDEFLMSALHEAAFDVLPPTELRAAH